MRAKMQCQSVTDFGTTEQVTLTAVYSSDPSNPNSTWSKFTPAATVAITISNPEARGHFKPGAEYFVDFSEAPKAAPAG